ncbi:MAG: Protease Do [Candidatus Wolfebacteria bacterium GW2011_GWC2_46_275]|uniref:Protease Do n=1 Tax=Candidatus Wolfebacteria bacterium GW2011_GWB1_47_1 TaxID=1619007 RepID=A0A0G4AU33_9BACT|nr:MAG: protease Do [Candidatus Wolfebacteria bacterium GW2011_GWB1_47_1]KKU37155.1 MAG: Protease Do [Candidatus Wolfebacteria bacterium GW2011_GWC2_46_275]KKU42685.1 MAG: Protease Do [Candidatus Wolfebacteria bacterium GW2011_GWB2_46_69]KKU54580.1 MAG: Protease Do [Candidatus Wolfebacteria bacterium GW2011_GWC1_47_103]KKU59964.1 MAG: Protease Do [Candidatus Wolfebacteria bacterium GW2011_GWE2_47_12]KKU66372.1 MAG: Protease Do [Candidatus Wolfebacteria bacterium GW2011_GWD2_47_17]KKU73885.1 M
MEHANNFVSVIKKVIPATVTIVVSKKFGEIEREAVEHFPDIPLWLKRKELGFLKQQTDKNGMLKVGNGSGFIVDPSGIVISNRHIVSETRNAYTIITNDGKKYPATILARDPLSDIAILKITGENAFPFLSLGDSSHCELGDPVIAVGNALGMFQNTVSSGIISGLSRAITAQIDASSPIQEIHGLIQTDAAINPGNSGGPLVGINGKVIGINVAIIQGAQNIGFALPINTLKKDLIDLRQFGRIRQPFLGVHYVTINETLQQKLKLPTDYGALVVSPKPYSESVITKSPAALAGIKDHDIILECNEKRISGEKTLGDMLESHTIGDIIRLKVLRKNRMFIVSPKLAEKK